MEYFITFLEGVLTFISPCLLPMLPIYFVYMAGDAEKRPVVRALAFVLGFSAIFMLMGAAAATFGRFIIKNNRIVSLVGGLIVVMLGVNFTGLLTIPFLNASQRINIDIKPTGFFSSVVFGMIFALGWTPCVGAFLGPALTMAAASETFSKGITLVGFYCVGLGLPFVLSALFINELGQSFAWIKKHYGIIHFLCGIFLVVLGVLMMVGWV